MREVKEMEDLLTLQNVGKAYGRTVILQDVNFKVRPGRIIGIVGDNGMGKTTLMKLMAGLLLPDKGQIIHQSKDYSYILCGEHFYPWMRVKDGFAFYRDYYDDFDSEKAGQLLGQSGIDSRKRIHCLSSGQQERFGLILGLSRRCSLYLMDESFGGIDPFFKRDTKRFLLENMEEGSSLVMATHLLKDLETLFDEVLFVTDKTVRQMETEEIRSAYGKSVEQYYMEDLAHGQNMG